MHETYFAQYNPENRSSCRIVTKGQIEESQKKGEITKRDVFWLPSLSSWLSFESLSQEREYQDVTGGMPPQTAPGSRDLFYRPSGKTRNEKIFLAVPQYFFGTILAAAAYGYALVYLPILFLKILMFVVFAVAAGAFAAATIHKMECRSPVVGSLTGAVLGVLAMYGSWVAYAYALNPALGVLAEPGKAFAFIQSLGESGYWSIRGWKPSGGTLFAFWGLEAVSVIACATLLGYSEATEPYCEKCQQWFTKSKLGHVGQLGLPQDEETLKQHLLSGSLDTLLTLPVLHPNIQWLLGTLEISVKSCKKSCHSPSYISISSRKYLPEKGKEDSVTTEELIKNMKIEAGLSREIQDYLETDLEKLVLPEDLQREIQVEGKENQDQAA